MQAEWFPLFLIEERATCPLRTCDLSILITISHLEQVPTTWVNLFKVKDVHIYSIWGREEEQRGARENFLTGIMKWSLEGLFAQQDFSLSIRSKSWNQSQESVWTEAEHLFSLLNRMLVSVIALVNILR